jgi:hypothetical protein
MHFLHLADRPIALPAPRSDTRDATELIPHLRHDTVPLSSLAHL